jgi:hypothetical protein
MTIRKRREIETGRRTGIEKRIEIGKRIEITIRRRSVTGTGKMRRRGGTVTARRGRRGGRGTRSPTNPASESGNRTRIGTGNETETGTETGTETEIESTVTRSVIVTGTGTENESTGTVGITTVTTRMWRHGRSNINHTIDHTETESERGIGLNELLLGMLSVL